jgi:Peptidase propeptide and YPEB domain
MRRLSIAVAAVLIGAAIAGGAVAIAAGVDDEGPTATGLDADRATASALAATGGGSANAVERDAQDGATWEVEVTRSDGSTVDVRLDERFDVVVIEGDDEAADDERA